MKKLQELQPLIIEWAKNKNIHLPECALKQRLKLIEECGELASAILKDNVELQKDAIGDIFVVLVILAEQIEDRINFVFCPTGEKDHYVMLLDLFASTDRQISTAIDYLNDISLLLNHDLTECANLAWNEIKDRKGNTVNGTFIKI